MREVNMKQKCSHWTYAEDVALEILLQHMTYKDAANALGRSIHAVKFHARYLGLEKKCVYPTVWSKVKEQKLLDMRRRGMVFRDIAEQLEMAYGTVRVKWIELNGERMEGSNT